MSTPTNPTPEEIRREMKSRFDAVNTTAEDGKQQRRDAGDLAVAEENKRWVKPEADAGPADDSSDLEEINENDSHADDNAPVPAPGDRTE